MTSADPGGSLFPSRGQRLRYTLGGRLPGHLPWVRHDLTTSGWRLRTLLRVLLQALPFAVVLAVLPGPAFLHVVMPLFVLVAAAFVGLAYGEELRDQRMRQHGLDPPPASGPAGRRDLG